MHKINCVNSSVSTFIDVALCRYFSAILYEMINNARYLVLNWRRIEKLNAHIKIPKENFDTKEHILHHQDGEGSHKMTTFQAVFGWITDAKMDADGNTVGLLKVDALHCL